jgi:hypothetical protein
LLNIGRFIRVLSDQFLIQDVFRLTPKNVNLRIRAKIQKAEVAGIGFALATLFWFIGMSGKFQTYYDLQNFLNVGIGDYSHYYYAYWAVPVFSLLAKLQYPYPFLIVGIANIIGTLFATRVWGGQIIPLLVSIHFIYIISQGQIVGIVLGGFALFVFGLVNRKWHLAGLGIVLATIKFQLGVIPALSLLILWECKWNKKAQVLLVPATVFALSLIIYPSWPFQLLANIKSSPPYPDGSISVWQWIGPFSLIFWGPPLLLRMPKNIRFILLLTANALALPYYQQTDLLILFAFFSGLGAAIANIPFLIPDSITPAASTWDLLRLLFLIPFGIHISTLGHWIIPKLNGKVNE